MINAISKNKVKRELFKGNEDSLTSFIFEKLNYLPRETFKYIFLNSIKDATFLKDIDFNDIEEIEYWPRWYKDKDKRNYVEPDVFIRHKKYDFIIEAKRWDTNQQSKNQWKNEIIAYFNEYGEEDKKELIFIALGGIRENETGEITIEKKNPIKIYKCKWQFILQTIQEIKAKLENSEEVLSSARSLDNILSDMIKAFEIYDYRLFTMKWFEDFNFRKTINQESINKLLEWKKFQNYRLFTMKWFKDFKYDKTINQESINKLLEWKKI